MSVTFTDIDGQHMSHEGDITIADLQRADPAHPILIDGVVVQYVKHGDVHFLCHMPEQTLHYTEPQVWRAYTNVRQ